MDNLFFFCSTTISSSLPSADPVGTQVNQNPDFFLIKNNYFSINAIGSIGYAKNKFATIGMHTNYRNNKRIWCFSYNMNNLNKKFPKKMF